MSAFRPPENKALRVDVANEIIQAIATGELKPGDRVIEQHIAEQMRISRAPVREALRELEGQGIIRTVDRKGSFIAELSPGDMEELFSLRGLLEGFAARLAVSRLDEHDIAQLVGLSGQMQLAAQASDSRAFMEADLAFHNLVCERAGHAQLSKTLEALKTRIRLFVLMSKQALTATHQLESEVDAHRRLIEVLESRDPDECEKAFRDHIFTTAKYLSRLLRTRQEAE